MPLHPNSQLHLGSVLVYLVSQDCGDVTLVTADGELRSNKLLLFHSLAELKDLLCNDCPKHGTVTSFLTDYAGPVGGQKTTFLTAKT